MSNISRLNNDSQVEKNLARLRKVAELSLTLSGDPVEIFQKISQMFGELLEVKIVCLSEIVGETLQFLSVYNNGDVVVNAGQCTLANTPCSTVQHTKDLRVYHNVTEEFPEAVFLKDHNAVSYCGFPALDSMGVVVAVICLLDDKFHDFTEDDHDLLRIFGQRIGFEIERKKRKAEKEAADKALMLSEELFRQMAENINEVFWIGSSNWSEVLYVSPAYEEIWGQSCKSLLANPRSWLEAIHEDDLAKVQMDIAKKSAGDFSDPNFPIYRIIRPDGTIRWISARAFPIRNASGEVYRVVGIAENITERINLEKEREKSNKLESLGILAGGIAHDFNNILAAILGNLNLSLYDEDLKDGTKKLLTEAEKASMRAKSLTHQLLTFSKGGEPIKETSSLENIIKDSANFVLQGSRVACDFNFSDQLRLVEIDKDQVSQVIQNLVINANHAMPDGGIVKITCENITLNDNSRPSKLDGGEYIKISIQDSGVGIPTNVVDKIFDPYFSTKDKGTGLGLAISLSIINKHQGDVIVESTPGIGSTFTIYLPATDKIEPEKQAPLIAQRSLSKAKVLVMDDDEMIRGVVKEMLKKLGHEVTLASDGSEAIKSYKESINSDNRFDLLIMDLTVPGGMGGKEAVQEILVLDKDAKAIVSSGYYNDPIMAHYQDYGFCSAIGKPFKLSELADVIEQVIN